MGGVGSLAGSAVGFSWAKSGHEWLGSDGEAVPEGPPCPILKIEQRTWEFGGERRQMDENQGRIREMFVSMGRLLLLGRRLGPHAVFDEFQQYPAGTQPARFTWGT